MDRIEHARQLLRKTAGFNKQANKYDNAYQMIQTLAKKLIRNGKTPAQILEMGKKLPAGYQIMLKKAVGEVIESTPKLTEPVIDVAAQTVAPKKSLKDFLKGFGKKGRGSGTIPGADAAKEWWGKNYDPDWTHTDWLGAGKKLAYTGAGVAGTKYLFDPTDKETQRQVKTKGLAPTAGEKADHRRSVEERRKSTTAQVSGADIPPELMAGAGGAMAGGALGYAAAPMMGLSRGVGALGGATISAVAGALLANRLKGQGQPAVT